MRTKWNKKIYKNIIEKCQNPNILVTFWPYWKGLQNFERVVMESGYALLLPPVIVCVKKKWKQMIKKLLKKCQSPNIVVTFWKYWNILQHFEWVLMECGYALLLPPLIVGVKKKVKKKLLVKNAKSHIVVTFWS